MAEFLGVSERQINIYFNANQGGHPAFGEHPEAATDPTKRYQAGRKIGFYVDRIGLRKPLLSKADGVLIQEWMGAPKIDGYLRMDLALSRFTVTKKKHRLTADSVKYWSSMGCSYGRVSRLCDFWRSLFSGVGRAGGACAWPTESS
jgi:hypothetical protein